jgi:hypothetical protein
MVWGEDGVPERQLPGARPRPQMAGPDGCRSLTISPGESTGEMGKDSRPSHSGHHSSHDRICQSYNRLEILKPSQRGWLCATEQQQVR